MFLTWHKILKTINQILQFSAVVICNNQYDEFLFLNCTNISTHLKIMVPGLRGPADCPCKSGDITRWGLMQYVGSREHISEYIWVFHIILVWGSMNYGFYFKTISIDLSWFLLIILPLFHGNFIHNEGILWQSTTCIILRISYLISYSPWARPPNFGCRYHLGWIILTVIFG